jgi:hypothetical protein
MPRFLRFVLAAVGIVAGLVSFWHTVIDPFPPFGGCCLIPGTLQHPYDLTPEGLRQFPTVAKVDVLVSTPQPKGKLFHLADYHHTSFLFFWADCEQVEGRKIPDKEAALQYRWFLEDVDKVQAELTTILRALIARHGLREVWVGTDPRGDGSV